MEENVATSRVLFILQKVRIVNWIKKEFTECYKHAVKKGYFF